jgi:hypothetical protein
LNGNKSPVRIVTGSGELAQIGIGVSEPVIGVGEPVIGSGEILSNGSESVIGVGEPVIGSGEILSNGSESIVRLASGSGKILCNGSESLVRLGTGSGEILFNGIESLVRLIVRSGEGIESTVYMISQRIKTPSHVRLECRNIVLHRAQHVQNISHLCGELDVCHDNCIFCIFSL